MPEGSQNENQIEITIPSLSRRVFFWEVFLFSITLGLGIATAVQIGEIFKIQKIEIPQISFWKFVLSFFLATLFILFIIYLLRFKPKKRIIFKFLFATTVFFGGVLFLEAWIPEPAPLIFILFLIFWWFKEPSILNQDILIILGLAGVGATLGLTLRPLMMVALLIIFSIYDFIAVYKTKHMIKMAKEMIESRAILALVIPSSVSGFKESLEKIEPGGKFLILGGGDIVFPLLFCASLIPSGILNSIIVAIFSLIGLFVGFYFFTKQKVRKAIPALPPIALFSIIGFLITRLI